MGQRSCRREEEDEVGREKEEEEEEEREERTGVLATKRILRTMMALWPLDTAGPRRRPS